MKVYEFLNFECLFFVLLVIFCLNIYAIISTKKDANIRLLAIFLLVTVLVELFSIIIYYNQKALEVENILGFFNVYNLFSFGLFFLLYKRLLGDAFNKLIFTFIIISICCVIFESLYFTNIKNENLTYSHILLSICLSIIVVLYFTKILREGQVSKLVESVYFWLSCGLLLYHIGQVPFRVVINLFTFEGTLNYIFFNINAVLRILMLVMIGIGLYKYIQQDE